MRVYWKKAGTVAMIDFVSNEGKFICPRSGGDGPVRRWAVSPSLGVLQRKDLDQTVEVFSYVRMRIASRHTWY